MKLQIAKLDAARRQLETAVTLYFSGGDAVSAHTLAAAGLGILTDISVAVEGDAHTFTEGIIAQFIKPEHRADFRAQIRKARNFFKHADTDHDAVLATFEPRETEIFLIDACLTYRRLTKERVPMFATFELWSTLTWAKDLLRYGGPDPIRWTG